MGLSEDQKAMLRLLAQRGEQGYEDIAALKGLSVEEVRAQARQAVRQLEDEGLPPPAIPLDPDDADRAAAPAPVEEARPEPSAAAPPPPPVPERAEPTPEAPAEPPPPPPPPLPPQNASPGPPRGGAKPKPSLPKDPGARAAIAVGLIAVVAIVVILIVGGGGGSSSTTTGTTSSETAAEGATTPTSSKELTQAILEPVAGGEGEGKAIFGRVKNKLALQVEASGLQPTQQGQAYTVWLAASPKKMLPLANAQTDKKGRIRAQFEVPTEVLAYLANETFGQIVVSRTSTALLKAALKKASSEKKAPVYTGTHVLEGTVTGPIVGAAKRLEEEKEGG